MAGVQQRAARLTPERMHPMHLPHPLARRVAAAALAALGSLGVAATGVAAASTAATTPSCTTPLQLRTIELVRTTDGPAIQVSGIKPAADTIVALVPEDVVYIQPPDYWNYSIQGCGGSGPATKVAFTEVLPITGPRGTHGIAIGGRTFDLPGAPAGPASS
jgi:hypothetical protein